MSLPLYSIGPPSFRVRESHISIILSDPRKGLLKKRENDIILSFEAMKKAASLVLIVIFSIVCSLFRKNVAPYSSGVIFPLVEDGELLYEGEIIPQIKRKEQFLYFSTRKGKVYCVDGQNRQIFWRFDASVSLASPAYLGENRVYVYDVEDTLYCLGEQGKLLWQKKSEEKKTSDIVENRGRTFFGTEKGNLYCLNAENGEEIWRYQADAAICSNLAIWRDIILFGCDDHFIYFIGSGGNLSGKHDAGSRTGRTLSADEDTLYFGTEDRHLHSLTLAKRKERWKIRSGESTYVPPAVDEKRVFFLCWNSVLYCLDKKKGAILWWGSVPSRSFFRVKVIEDKVVVSSMSSELVSFDKKTGEEKGTYDASSEIVSNPVWVKPFLLVNLYDWESETGKLVILRKEVKVVLSPSKKPPQKRNEEIVFNARETGFYLPKFEFYLTRLARYRLYPDLLLLVPEGERQVIQKSSEESSWSWFPEQEGYYKVEVLVTDEKEKAQAEFLYSIQKGEAAVSLTASLKSPQAVGKEIVFKAVASGMSLPKFEFRLSRLSWLKVLADFVVLYPDEERIVQESSESDAWTWIPEDNGFYRIRVIAQDDRDKAEAEMPFAIQKMKNE
jgi:outer membrane protein assembly factor BamB